MSALRQQRTLNRSRAALLSSEVATDSMNECIQIAWKFIAAPGDMLIRTDKYESLPIDIRRCLCCQIENIDGDAYCIC